MTERTKRTKAYLGDAVYADCDGCGVILTTENGIRATNTIFLEPGVVDQFEQWLKRLRFTHLLDGAARLQAEDGRPRYVAKDASANAGYSITTTMPLTGEWYSSDGVRHGQ